MQQAKDFLEESRDVDALINELDDDGLQQKGDFKDWSIEDIIGHLYFWNRMAFLSLTDGDGFQREFAPLAEYMFAGKDLKAYEREALAALRGADLVAIWRAQFEETAAAYMKADPSQRCVWAGPSMSARSSISARQMETWSHAQAIYDVVGKHRVDTDRLRNIVVLGVNTFGWSFQVRGEAVPEAVPYLELAAPSGEIWTFNDASEENVVRGSATAFAQVVTQTRNVADTSLTVIGDVANTWMSNAQCFAGGPVKPPAQGARYTH